MEEITDSSVFQAILILKAHNENNEEDEYHRLIRKTVENWKKELEVYQKNVNSYNSEERVNNYNKLMSWRPKQREFELAKSKPRTKSKSYEVIEAENLLNRVKKEINEVLL